MTKGKRPSPFIAWSKTPEAKAARELGLARAHAAPRCGAKTRSGEPCRHPAMANGRCYLHGGLTPRGENWHKPQPPARKTAARLERKLLDLQKAAAKREARIAAMTPEERARYERRRQTCFPGPREAREAARERRKRDKQAKALLAAPAAPVARGKPEIEAEILRLEIENATLAGIGVFG